MAAKGLIPFFMLMGAFVANSKISRKVRDNCSNAYKDLVMPPRDTVVRVLGFLFIAFLIVAITDGPEMLQVSFCSTASLRSRDKYPYCSPFHMHAFSLRSIRLCIFFSKTVRYYNYRISTHCYSSSGLILVDQPHHRWGKARKPRAMFGRESDRRRALRWNVLVLYHYCAWLWSADIDHVGGGLLLFLAMALGSPPPVWLQLLHTAENHLRNSTRSKLESALFHEQAHATIDRELQYLVNRVCAMDLSRITHTRGRCSTRTQ